MDVSIFLARVLGLYLVIVCLPLLLKHKKFLPVLKASLENAPFMLFAGVIAVTIGILIIVAHNSWTIDWRVLITIVGWLALSKGILLFIFPNQAVRISNSLLQTKLYTVLLCISIIVGICLIYHGFIIQS